MNARFFIWILPKGKQSYPKLYVIFHWAIKAQIWPVLLIFYIAYSTLIIQYCTHNWLKFKDWPFFYSLLYLLYGMIGRCTCLHCKIHFNFTSFSSITDYVTFTIYLQLETIFQCLHFLSWYFLIEGCCSKESIKPKVPNCEVEFISS